MDKKSLLSPFALAALLVALAFSSCSKVNDMHDATMQMAATTQHMAGSTDALGNSTTQLKSSTDDLKALMGQIFDSGRQGASLDLRTKLWDEMLNAKQVDAKAADAALFYEAFEFQLWSDIGLDAAKAERLRLTQDAACEFFGRLAGVAHWAAADLDPFAGAMPVLMANPLKPADLDGEKAAFNALAVTLEKKNREQELVPSSATDELSMLGIIESALTAGQKIKAGKAKIGDYPAYVDFVLQNEELATRLLLARHQMMALATLCKLTTMCQDLEQGAKIEKLGMSWDLDFSQLNVSETNLMSFYVGEAISARDFLAGMGIQSTLNADIAKVYSHANVKNAPSAAAAKTSELAQSQLKLMSQLANLTK